MPHDRYRPPGQPGTRQPRQVRPATTRGTLLWAVAGVGVLVGLFLFGAAAQNFRVKDTAAATTGIGSPKGTGQPKATSQPKGAGRTSAKGTKSPGFGDAVRDGKFEFVVSRADCSRSSLGPRYLNRTAQGKYCVVDLSVKNIADKPQFFVGSAQEAFDATGYKFTDDEVAGIYANSDTQTFLKKIDPGEKVVGKLVFDVPRSTTLTTVELHDSFFSGGVQVALR